MREIIITESDLYDEFHEWIDTYVKINIPLDYDDTDYEESSDKLEGWFRERLFIPWLKDYHPDLVRFYEKEGE